MLYADLNPGFPAMVGMLANAGSLDQIGVPFHKIFGELGNKEFAELERRGVKAQAMPPEAGKRFVEAARKYNYQRMKERLDKLPDGPASYERFVKLFGPGA